MWRNSILRSRAQSLVEFALMLPILIAVLFGIVELGMLFNIYIGLTNSAREAARAGSVYQASTALTTSSDASAADSQRSAYINKIIKDTLNPSIDPSTDLTVAVTYLPTAAVSTNLYRSGDTLTVELVHTHKLFFGLLGPSSIDIHATSSMRIEPGGTQ